MATRRTTRATGSWADVVDYERLTSALLWLLHQGRAQRARGPDSETPSRRGGHPDSEAAVHEIAEALGIAMWTEDRRELRRFRRAALRTIAWFDESVSVRFDEGRTPFVRGFALRLRDEVEERVGHRTPDQIPIPRIARLCAARIDRLTVGMSRVIPGRSSYPRILAALARLSARRNNAQAIVLCALRVCGYRDPNLFKAEAMVDTRTRARVRSRTEIR